MVSALVSNVSILGVNLLITYFTVVGDIEMLAVRTFDMVLHCMQLGAVFPTDQTSVASSSVLTNKLL